MAERSSTIADGSRIATRDANVDDADTNARDVQYFDATCKYHGLDFDTVNRTVSSDDDLQFSTIPSGILSNAITIGEATTFTCIVQYYCTGSTVGNVIVTPIVIDSGDDALGFFELKVFSGFAPPGAASALYTTGNYTLCMVQTWSVKGGAKIGVHVTLTGGVTSADIWYAATTGAIDEWISDSTPSGSGSWEAYQAGGGE